MDTAAVGDYVQINSPEHWAHREWGIVRLVEDGEYHVLLWGESTHVFLFCVDELEEFKYETG